MSNTDPHPPEHVLAELADSADPVGEETSVAYAHVQDCEFCQAVLDRLTEVRQLLHALPSRLPTPPSVSARLTDALAAEAEASAGHSAAEGTGASVTSIHDRPVAWFRRRLPQTLAAAAAAAAIGLIGFTVVAGDPPDFTTAGSADSDDAESSDSVMADQPEMESAPEGADAREDQATAEDYGEADDADQGVEASGLQALPPDALVLAVLDVWENGSEVEPRCGEALADDLGVDLVGTTYAEGEILAVVTDDDLLTGWVIPDCEAEADAAVEIVQTPVPGS